MEEVSKSIKRSKEKIAYLTAKRDRLYTIISDLSEVGCEEAIPILEEEIESINWDIIGLLKETDDGDKEVDSRGD